VLEVEQARGSSTIFSILLPADVQKAVQKFTRSHKVPTTHQNQTSVLP
jgi:hypothetical protein